MRLVFLCCIILSLMTPAARADVYRPAFLEFTQTSKDNYDLLWKVPVSAQGRRPDISVVLPTNVRSTRTRSMLIGGVFIDRSILTVNRPDGLAGAEISILGLERSPVDVLIRIARLDGTSETARLNSVVTSFVVRGTPEFWDVVNTYVVFGVEHILTGFDHLLFVACLIFIAGASGNRWRRILVTITGFTVAHSITLTLAALGLVQLPIQPIEATIALSIVFLAREIILDRRDTLTWRFPIAVSATFGLLHGFGFASALSEIGLPQTEIPAALLAFNVGVEIGQILFVAAILSGFYVIEKGLKIPQTGSNDWLVVIEKPVAYAVGSITMLWTIERVSGFSI